MMMMMLNESNHQNNVQHHWPVVMYNDNSNNNVSVIPQEDNEEEEKSEEAKSDNQQEATQTVTNSSNTNSKMSDISSSASSDEEEESSSLSAPSSFSTSSITSSEDDDDDLDNQIEYVREKADLLQRVTRRFNEEQEYCASIARKEQHALEDDEKNKEGTLWTEAKEVLQVLYRGEAGPDLHEKMHENKKNSVTDTTNKGNSKKREYEESNKSYAASTSSSTRTSDWKDMNIRSAAMHRLIDMSHVHRVSSEAYGVAEHPTVCTYSDRGFCPKPKRVRRALKKHPWMMSALRGMQQKVKVTKDPQDCVDLREATAITDTPQ